MVLILQANLPFKGMSRFRHSGGRLFCVTIVRPSASLKRCLQIKTDRAIDLQVGLLRAYLNSKRFELLSTFCAAMISRVVR